MSREASKHLEWIVGRRRFLQTTALGAMGIAGGSALSGVARADALTEAQRARMEFFA